MPMPDRDQAGWWRPRRMLCRFCGRSFERRPGYEAQIDCGSDACIAGTARYVASLGVARDASQMVEDALGRTFAEPNATRPPNARYRGWRSYGAKPEQREETIEAPRFL